MSKILAGMGMSTGVAATAGAAALAIGAIAWTQFGGSKAPVEAEQAALVQPEPAPDAVVSSEPDAVETAAKVPAPAPSFDEVRREEDGMTVIAGRALPGAAVLILKDGVEVARTRADGAGKFAALMMIAPDGAGHVLSLLQQFDGSDVPSEGQIILAPLAPPVALAEAELPDVREPQTPEVDPAPLPDNTQRVEAAPTEPAAVAVQTEEITVADAAQTTSEAPAQVAEQEPAVATAPATQEVAESGPAQTPVDPDAAVPAEVEIAQGDDPTPTTHSQAAVETAQADPVVTEAPAETAITPVAPPPTANAAVAVLKATPDGVELLNAQGPDVMDTVALDTISYSETGDVQLAGRAQTEAASVRVYLNNDAVVNLPVDVTGRWRGDLPNVDEGIYTLRVDEVASDGAVISRVETPFKREAPDVLAAASAQSEGAIKAITVQKGATLWAIAQDRYGKGELYVRVFEANRAAIRDPDLIYPGQIFDLPSEEG